MPTFKFAYEIGCILESQLCNITEAKYYYGILSFNSPCSIRANIYINIFGGTHVIFIIEWKYGTCSFQEGIISATKLKRNEKPTIIHEDIHPANTFKGSLEAVIEKEWILRS